MSEERSPVDGFQHHAVYCRHSGQSRRGDPRSVWITCTDAVMEQALQPLHELGSALILRRSQFGCCDGPGDACEGLSIIEQAVRHRNVREIVVCGHACCSAFPQEFEVPAALKNADLGTQLLRRAREREIWNHRARERLIRQVAELEQRPLIAHLVASREVSVHGLFTWPKAVCSLHITRPADNSCPCRS